MTKNIIDELTSVIKKVKNSKSHIRRVTVIRELHSAATMATHITAINECTVSNHAISDTDATEGMNVAAVAAPVAETYALNTTSGSAETTAGTFVANATGTEGSTYVLNDNQAATEHPAPSMSDRLRHRPEAPTRSTQQTVKRSYHQATKQP